MAKTTAAAPFDVSAFLAERVSKPKRSMLGFVSEKFDNLTARSVHYAGRAADSLTGLGDIYEQGRKEGQIDAMLRVREFEQRTAERIKAKLIAAGIPAQ